MAYKKTYFDENSKEPFKVSRSKIEFFLECPRCFYLDRRFGVARPSIPTFSLNSAVDNLLKKEFDIHRAGKTIHPLMQNYGFEFVPFQHVKIDEWRDTFRGVGFLHEKTNFWVYGAVDDIWTNKNNELFIVDYKATSTEKEISLDDKWKEAYKRQMEIYQWLSRNNEDLKNYNISDTGYFVYCNGKKDREAFDGKLEFDVQIMPYKGNSNWIEPVINEVSLCLKSKSIPESSEGCEYCRYIGKYMAEKDR